MGSVRVRGARACVIGRDFACMRACVIGRECVRVHALTAQPVESTRVRARVYVCVHD